jgi:Putative metallopeptidase
MKRSALIACMLPFAVFLGCAGETEVNTDTAPPAVAKTAAAETAAAPRTGGPRFRRVARLAAKQGRGQLKFAYGPAKTEERRELVAVLREERLFEDVIDNLNKGLVLPRDITVRFETCGEPNAFYDPEARKVSLCYELYDQFMTLFTPGETEEGEAVTKSVAALVFVFYHELGHALIDIYDLPATGREEDAVDQLATVLLLETWEGEDSELAILSSAEWFELDEDEADMADEHSLDEQRYYNLVCWIYGSDPDYFSGLADDWGLPEARAQQCSSEYARMSGAWNTLLGPHMRAGTGEGAGAGE